MLFDINLFGEQIPLLESNTVAATTKEYLFRVEKFCQFMLVVCDDELIDYLSEELVNMLVNHTHHLVRRVNSDDLNAIFEN